MIKVWGYTMDQIKFSERRLILHYLATLIFIGIYGVQVCPFIEGLSRIQLFMPLVVIVGVQYLLHLALQHAIICKSPLESQVKRTFQLEMSLYVISGFTLAASNSIVYEFPVESGLKMVLGFATLGLFTSIDLALKHERKLVAYIKDNAIRLQPNENYFPLVGKFSLLAGITITLIMTIMFLVVVKDLE